MTLEADASDDIPTAEARLARIDHATLSEKVYAELREAVMGGAFAPGESLTIRGVAEALGTSVMPVRDALRRLSGERGLEILANRGMRVPLLDQTHFDELVQVRLMLEGHAAARAAARISPDEIEQARRNHAGYADAAGSPVEARMMANRHFHFTVYRAARSPLLLSLIEMLWLQSGPCLVAPMRWHSKVASDSRYFAVGIGHHEELLDSLARHDGPGAERAVCADICDAAEVYRLVLAEREAEAQRALLKVN